MIYRCAIRSEARFWARSCRNLASLGLAAYRRIGVARLGVVRSFAESEAGSETMYCNAQTETIRSGTAAAMGSECCSYRRIARLAVAGLILGLGTVLAPEPAAAGYFVTNLVSDVPGLAPIVDPNLVNPWGLTRSNASPWWVADNGTGVSTLYEGNGTPRPLIVTIPPPAGG